MPKSLYRYPLRDGDIAILAKIIGVKMIAKPSF
jgi:hypothetical protein